MERLDRINQLMRREIGNILLEEFHDPLFTFVSVTKVMTSRDLKQARVYFSFYGEKGQLEAVGQSLGKIRGYLRKLIGQRIRMRYTPELIFVYDDSILYAARIEETLQELRQQDEQNSSDNS